MDQVFIKQRNLKLVILQIRIDLLPISFLNNRLHNCIHIKLFPQLHYPLVKILKRNIKPIVGLLRRMVDHADYLLFKHFQVWKRVHHLLQINFVGELSLQLYLSNVVAHILNKLFDF